MRQLMAKPKREPPLRLDVDVDVMKKKGDKRRCQVMPQPVDGAM